MSNPAPYIIYNMTGCYTEATADTWLDACDILDFLKEIEKNSKVKSWWTIKEYKNGHYITIE